MHPERHPVTLVYKKIIIKVGGEEMDIIAPCPHKSACPRYENDNIPFNFMVKYR